MGDGYGRADWDKWSLVVARGKETALLLRSLTVARVADQVLLISGAHQLVLSICSSSVGRLTCSTARNLVVAWLSHPALVPLPVLEGTVGAT